MGIRRYLFLSFFFGLVVTAPAKTPERIVSLAPFVTKMIYLLEAEDQLVGCTSFCTLRDPSDAVVVATAVTVNLERVVLLKPDLVLTSSLTSPETIQSLEKLGIEVLNFPYSQSFEDLFRDVKVLAEKTGREELANRILGDTREKLKQVRDKVPETAEKPRIFAQIGTNPLWAVVPGTFMNDFIEFAGGVNIVSNLRTGSIAREAVLTRDPDVIFIMMMGSLNRDEKQKWEQYKGMKAVKNRKIFLMDQEKTCSPTPPDFVEALEEMIGHIYGKDHGAARR
jgi:iron complex transport system substrate-binding protein